MLNKQLDASLNPMVFDDPERNWSEDAGLENGNYVSFCSSCRLMFVGHKRRDVCRKCAGRDWVGVDLDGTLAQYDTWRGWEHIGAPVMPMVRRVREWLGQGREVKIMTARVSPASLVASGVARAVVVGRIEDWCDEHLGRTLPVTHEKDLRMVELWDDRCVQVIPNSGVRADETREKYYELLYAVERAFPGETRHQTALRYLREREKNRGGCDSAKSNH